MKIILLSFAVLMSVNYGVLHAEDSRASALPATNAILTQDDKRNAIISYTIEQVPAIVTLAIQTGGKYGIGTACHQARRQLQAQYVLSSVRISHDGRLEV